MKSSLAFSRSVLTTVLLAWGATAGWSQSNPLSPGTTEAAMLEAELHYQRLYSTYVSARESGREPQANAVHRNFQAAYERYLAGHPSIVGGVVGGDPGSEPGLGGIPGGIAWVPPSDGPGGGGSPDSGAIAGALGGAGSQEVGATQITGPSSPNARSNEVPPTQGSQPPGSQGGAGGGSAASLPTRTPEPGQDPSNVDPTTETEYGPLPVIRPESTLAKAPYPGIPLIATTDTALPDPFTGLHRGERLGDHRRRPRGNGLQGPPGAGETPAATGTAGRGTGGLGPLPSVPNVSAQTGAPSNAGTDPGAGPGQVSASGSVVAQPAGTTSRNDQTLPPASGEPFTPPGPQGPPAGPPGPQGPPGPPQGVPNPQGQPGSNPPGQPPSSPWSQPNPGALLPPGQETSDPTDPQSRLNPDGTSTPPAEPGVDRTRVPQPPVSAPGEIGPADPSKLPCNEDGAPDSSVNGTPTPSTSDTADGAGLSETRPEPSPGR